MSIAKNSSAADKTQLPLEPNDDGLDGLLDEIEDLIGEDAQTFVAGFVQKGGE